MNRRKSFGFVIMLAFFALVYICAAFAVINTGEVNVLQAEPTEVTIKGESYKTEKEYMIKEYYGNIGIYQKGADGYILIDIIDTNVDVLPKVDIDLLKEGIYLEDEKQMLMLLEDFTS